MSIVSVGSRNSDIDAVLILGGQRFTASIQGTKATKEQLQAPQSISRLKLTAKKQDKTIETSGLPQSKPAAEGEAQRR